MKKCLLLALVVVLYLPSRAQQVLFGQNFSSSSTLGSFFTTTSPGPTRFTSQGAGTNATVRIDSSGQISVLKTASSGSTSTYMVRSAAYAVTPTVLIVKFDFQVASISATQAQTCTFYMGSNTGFADNVSTQQGDAFVKLAFGTSNGALNAGDTFNVRNAGTSITGPSKFQGKRTIMVVANNSGSSYSYTAPDGTTESVADGKWDVWAGASKEFDDQANNATGTKNLNGFKIVYATGSVKGVTYFDNFLITAPLATSTKTWIGNDGNWNTPTNWNPSGVPGSTDNIVISSGTPSLDIDYTLPNTQFLQLSGTGNLNINAGKTLTVAGAADFGGKLVTLQADTTAGTIAAIKGSGTGSVLNATNVTLQVPFTAQRGYRVLSNPFSTALTTATVGADNGITITGANDVKTFDGVSNTWTGSISSVPSKTAYSVFYRGKTTDVTGLVYTAGPYKLAYSVNGTLNSAPVRITPSAGATSWNITGNPLPAPVNSSALTGATAGVSYYIYNASKGSTGARVKAGGWDAAGAVSSITTPIPVMGVVAYQTGSLSTFSVLNSDINTTDIAQTGLFGLNDATTQVELQINKDGNYHDKLFVRYDANGTEQGTERMDLPKISNDVTNIYTVTSDKARLAVDARKGINASIPVGVSAPAGNYTFTVASNNFVNASNMYLLDKLLNTKTKLEAGATYNFAITADPATQGDNRFELGAVKTPAQDVIASETFTAKVLGNVVSNIATVQVKGAKSTSVQITVTDMQGKIITNTTSSNAINKISLAGGSGMYFIKVTDGENSIINKVVKP